MGHEIPSRFNIAEWFVDRPAEAHPERIAILGEPRAVCYGELRELANRVGNALLAGGCGRGDRVLIVLRDSAEFIAAFFGAAKIGAIPVPVNSFARAGDYSFYLLDSGASIAIVDEAALSEFAAGARANNVRVVVVGGDNSGSDIAGGRAEWAEWIAAASPELSTCVTAACDPAFLLYTSGSGGRPKAPAHQHKDMLVATRSYGGGVVGIRGDDRFFSVSKLFFAYGLGNGMYFPFSVGASTILNPEKTRIERVAELVAKHRPTIFFGVPTFYAALLQGLNRGLAVDLSSVRLAVSAGEPLPAEIFVQFRERFGIEILDGIGSTEMLHIFISNRPGSARAGTCGTPVPNYEMRIADDGGQPCRADEIGNLFVKGESAFAEYWQKPEYTARVKSADGWVATGDKFFCDADGYYHYSGRSDDMMKVSGMWVSPIEVENALLGDERVAEAAVVGVADGAGLVKPVAYVVLTAGIEPDRDIAHAIQESVRARLVHYKCPREFHFVAELPKTVTGKIQRYLLRDRQTRD
ncbi:MAG TPA: benzoate-CoA ligase family protein [Candidatus Acidoferrales bacterium]